MFLLTRDLRVVEQALEERGVRDRAGGDHRGVRGVRTGRIVSFDTINDDGADDNEGQELYPVTSSGGFEVEI